MAAYMNMKGGLLVSSNLSLGELAERVGDDRLSSRLAQMCRGNVFSLAGEKDWRVQ
jgi:DNA replication protein DnaC